MKKQDTCTLSFLFVFLLSLVPINETLSQSTTTWTTFEKKSEKKMSVVFITSPWDGWSRRMENQTFTDSKVVKYSKKKFNFIYLDKENRQSIIHNGTIYRFDKNVGKRGCHELATELAGGEVLPPITVIMDKEGNVVQTITGYINARDMEAILRFYGEGKDEEQSWEEFSKDLNRQDEPEEEATEH